MDRDLFASRFALHAGFFNTVPWYGVDLRPFAEPTRVAFAGCWHAQSGPARDAMRAAAEAGVTVLVHTGDFLYTHPVADRLVAAVEEEAGTLGMTVVVVRGNHDDPGIYAKAAATARRRKPADGFARLSPRVLHAPNGMRWTWQGVTFAALGGAHSVDRAARRVGESWWRGEVASTREVTQVVRGGAADVLITHDIPAGADLPFPPDPPDWWDVTGANSHRDRLRSAVEGIRPAWVIGGHMHFRHTTDMYLDDGHRVAVEVLDQVEKGVTGNLLIADLRDGVLTPLA